MTPLPHDNVTAASTEHMPLVHHHLEHSADHFGDKTALIHAPHRVSYRQINQNANQLAAYLVHEGVKPGDRIILMMDNRLEYVIAYYAILKAGGVAVPFSNDLKPAGIQHLMQELVPTAVVSSQKFSNRFFGEKSKSGHSLLLILTELTEPIFKKSARWVPWRSALENFPKHNLKLDIKPSDLAGIIYTSGSSGRPKGVMLSHRNITANTISICQYLAITEKDVQMVVLPFFYVMGKSLLNTLFRAGGTVVINNRFAFPATVVNEMIQEKVTLFSGVPSTYTHLLHRSPLAASRDQLSALRCCTQAGGHMAVATKKALLDTLPDHTQLCIMYGATEASARLTWLDPSNLENKMNSIGKAIPGVTIQVLDPQNNLLPAGEVGELVATGDNIMQGYWNNPEATARALDEHGYHTGDQGFMDDDGFLFLEGRKDSLIKVGGHRISPQEIEDALLETGRVVEAAVMGQKDDLLGHRLVALVVMTSPDTDQNFSTLKQQLANHLPGYKLPADIIPVRQLPKTASGKIDRNRSMRLI